MRTAYIGIGAVFAAALMAASSAVASDSLISEIRLGALGHDQGFTSHKEDGIDVNVEILFADTGWLGEDWSFRPNVGGNFNTEGSTNQGYFGMVIGHDLFGPFFVDVGAGGAYHDGKLDTPDPDRHSLGCHMLFHLQGDVGIELGDTWSLMAHIDHISNADLCDRNEGLTDIGVRLGMRY